MTTRGQSVGIDEVGRGAFAGPVIVGAVAVKSRDIIDVLEKEIGRPLADSKKLSRAHREALVPIIMAETVWSVGAAPAEVVDSHGIIEALRQAAGQALEPFSAAKIVADAGLRHPYESTIPTEWFVKGDETILEITLASIIAKVHRDQLMYELAKAHSEYGWNTNVGYGTLSHRQAIALHGLTPYHRKSFSATVRGLTTVQGNRSRKGEESPGR